MPRFLVPFFFCLIMAGITLSGCITTGTGSTDITGAAGGAASVDASTNLLRCDEPLGTLAIDDGSMLNSDENQTQRRYSDKVMSIEPLIRLAAQQSNCFVITSAGNIRTDNRLQRLTDIQRDSGEYRAGSKQHKGQRVAVDYFLEPSIVINNSSTGKVTGAVSSVVGGALGGMFGSLLSSAGSSVESKISVVTLSLYDVRSSLQLSISEGSATATNFEAAISALGDSSEGMLGAMTSTPEGKATVAAFLDAYNKMVISLRNYKAQDVKGGLGRGGRLKVN